MINDYITISRLVRSINTKCVDAYSSEVKGKLKDHDLVANYILSDLRELKRLWPRDLDRSVLEKAYLEIENEAWRGKESMFLTTLFALDEVMEPLEQHFSNQEATNISTSILDYLHPSIINSSYHHFRNGHYRDAVLNAILAVFDLIRHRTGIDLDGSKLAQTVFSVNSPKLIVSNMRTESGRNDQIGFMKLLEGTYWSVRNPKAHSLSVNPDKIVAAQNLIFASLLARRVENAELPEKDTPE
ncbi:MAG: TIGR02391 family protein [Anaerolineaceae bacterium]|nr:TIGR02391 family protein [Anaerolineaceae bacterium]